MVGKLIFVAQETISIKVNVQIIHTTNRQIAIDRALSRIYSINKRAAVHADKRPLGRLR